MQLELPDPGVASPPNKSVSGRARSLRLGIQLIGAPLTLRVRPRWRRE